MAQRWAQAQKEIADGAERKIAQVRADAAIAEAAAGRLQPCVDALVAAARTAVTNPTTAQGSAPATDALDLLANLQRQLDERAEQLAAASADDARIAGQATL